MSINVLLVEDSPGDVRLTEEAFCKADGLVVLYVANDGVEALAFLWRKGWHLDAPRPDFILLDLNLPKVDGREVLAAIKDDDDLKTIPTIILTTSEAEIDISTSYRLQANGYLSKPLEFESFETLVNSVSDLWLTKAKLPSAERTSPADAGMHCHAVTGQPERRNIRRAGRRHSDPPDC